LGTEIIEQENILQEMSLFKKDDKGHSKLCFSVDVEWNNRGSGKPYNSDLGHDIITSSNMTGKVVVLHYMSKWWCITCELEKKLFKHKEHNNGVCSQNYFGSSKDM
jgi:hypothetical protein